MTRQKRLAAFDISLACVAAGIALVVTSHIAGRSQLSWGRVQNVFCENVLRIAGGLAMLNVVDKRKGY